MDAKILLAVAVLLAVDLLLAAAIRRPGRPVDPVDHAYDTNPRDVDDQLTGQDRAHLAAMYAAPTAVPWHEIPIVPGPPTEESR